MYADIIFFSFYCLQEDRPGMFNQETIGITDSEGQQLAASSLGGDNDDYVNSSSLLQTDGDRNRNWQRPLVELNRNTKCQLRNSPLVNSALSSNSVVRHNIVFNVVFHLTSFVGVVTFWNKLFLSPAS
jgi:hypothetical protein